MTREQKIDAAMRAVVDNHFMKYAAPGDLVVGDLVVPRFFALRELMGYRGRVTGLDGDEIMVVWYEGERCRPDVSFPEPRRNLYKCVP